MANWPLAGASEFCSQNKQKELAILIEFSKFYKFFRVETKCSELRTGDNYVSTKKSDYSFSLLYRMSHQS